ncbi:MAG: hypothetical protein J6X45_04480, partial [Lachnospiraceae bacterium]|nr:hypothetical protein [Lachnospiraceae bacterium]
MWISRDDFERLVKDRDDAVRESGRLLTALCAEKEKNEGLSRKCCDYATQIRKEQESTDEALDTLDTIINLTFKGNDCLETVVFS